MNLTRAKRKKELRQAIANERLEGLEMSRATITSLGSYVAEKATLREVADKIRLRYGAA